jgi:AbrB family looped-hinge helix DNA binding protein
VDETMIKTDNWLGVNSDGTVYSQGHINDKNANVGPNTIGYSIKDEKDGHVLAYISGTIGEMNSIAICSTMVKLKVKNNDTHISKDCFPRTKQTITETITDKDGNSLETILTFIDETKNKFPQCPALKVDSRGRVTIPEYTREVLGIGAGDYVDLVEIRKCKIPRYR